MAGGLITIGVAKDHLRIDHAEDDTQIELAIDDASAAVLGYIHRVIGTPSEDDPSIVDWTPDTVPLEIRRAVMIMLSHLYDDRSAGAQSNDIAMGYLPLAVTSLLHRWRDPVMA